jgi:excisionase family DNA binding protein
MDEALKMLTVAQAAALLQCSSRNVKRLCESGRLAAVDIGAGSQRNWRIAPDSLSRIENNRSPTKPTQPRSVTKAKPFVYKYMHPYH